jgi:hypothetical protein
MHSRPAHPGRPVVPAAEVVPENPPDAWEGVKPRHGRLDGARSVIGLAMENVLGIDKGNVRPERAEVGRSARRPGATATGLG